MNLYTLPGVSDQGDRIVYTVLAAREYPSASEVYLPVFTVGFFDFPQNNPGGGLGSPVDFGEPDPGDLIVP